MYGAGLWLAVMQMPPEQPRSRTAHESVGTGEMRGYTYAVTPLAAMMAAVVRTNSSPLLRLSRAMATEGLSKFAFR